MTDTARQLLHVDPRVKIAAVLLLGVALWNTGWWGVALCGAMLAPILAVTISLREEALRMFKGFLWFTLFWTLLKLALGLIGDVPGIVSMSGALFFGARLFLLLLLGLALFLTTSARQIGQSLVWAFRPLIGRERAWRMALTMALMVHFIPQCIQAIHLARQALAMRIPSAGFYRKMVLLPQMILRFMGQKTWNQTLAVTVRGLDSAAAWSSSFNWEPRDAWAGCLLGLFVLGILLL